MFCFIYSYIFIDVPISFYVHECFVWMFVDAARACWCPKKLGEGMGSPETRVLDAYETPHEC